jgi:hypothetical protein
MRGVGGDGEQGHDILELADDDSEGGRSSGSSGDERVSERGACGRYGTDDSW